MGRSLAKTTTAYNNRQPFIGGDLGRLIVDSMGGLTWHVVRIKLGMDGKNPAQPPPRFIVPPKPGACAGRTISAAPAGGRAGGGIPSGIAQAFGIGPAGGGATAGAGIAGGSPLGLAGGLGLTG